MSIRRPLIGLIVFLVIAIGLTSTVVVTLRRDVRGDTTTYTAPFTDVTGLKVGDDVRMAGIRVGRIDDIELDGTIARVRFRIADDQVVDSDTTATITYQNIVGQRYLALSRRPSNTGGQPLVDNVIPMSHTEPSFDISVLLNGFEPLFSVLEPKQVQNVTAAIIRALQGDSGSVATLIAQTSTLAESIIGPDDVLGRVITNLSTVVGTLAAQRGEVDSVVGRSREIFTTLAERQDEFLPALDVTAKVVDRASVMAAGAFPELQQMISREPGFVGHFLANKDSFAYLGFNLPPLLKGLARVTQAGSYIDTYLCNFNVTLLPALSTVIPSVVSAATPGGRITNSPICR